MKRYNVHNMIRLRPITKPNDFGLKWRCKVYFDGIVRSWRLVVLLLSFSFAYP